MSTYILTPEERLIADANSEEIDKMAKYYLDNISRMTEDKAKSIAEQHVVFGIIRKSNPLYGHDEESLIELYRELKSIEDAETGADREADYRGTDEEFLDMEEITAYILKYNMYY